MNRFKLDNKLKQIYIMNLQGTLVLLLSFKIIQKYTAKIGYKASSVDLDRAMS